MSRNMRNIQNNLFFVTIAVLLVGMVNITFTLVGLSCFILPFYFYFKDKDKTWCKKICPRAGMFSRLVSKVSLGKKPPKWLTGKRAKQIAVGYFAFYLLFVTFTTTRVALGLMPPVEQFRFVMVVKMPELPQLMSFSTPAWVAHLSYRIYSMLFSSTVIGVTLGILYKPRTWCAICPVSTLTPIKKKA